MDRANLKFKIQASFLAILETRAVLADAKRTVLWHYPDATVEIHEEKMFLTSLFTFVGKNIPEDMAMQLASWYNARSGS